MKQLQKTILATLTYHDIFKYPLKGQEIETFLVQIRNPKSEILNPDVVIEDARLKRRHKSKFSKSQIQNNLKTLITKKKIFKNGSFYFLPGREKTVSLRKRREKYSEKKIKIAKNIVKILKFIPWIKMIGITGALAMHNSDKDDDIDFLVITAKNKLWLTRLLMVVVLEILGKRRRPKDKKFKNKICLNMFLDEKALRLAQGKQSLFTAHEIVQMKMIFNRNKTYERFLRANLWVKKYLPNGLKARTPPRLIRQLADRVKLEKENPGGERILNLLETLAYQLQLKYMKSKITSEQISPHFAFFHIKDRGKEILKKFKKKFFIV